MRLTVFGATGGIGGHVVRQALQAGHQVTAVVRDPSRFSVSDPALTVATVPDLTVAEPLVPIVTGADAVISAIGPRRRADRAVASGTTRAILAALSTAGVARLEAVSAAPVGPVPEGESFVNKQLLYPLISALLRETYADLARMEDEIQRNATDWTVIRPPRLLDRPLTGTYRTQVGGSVPRGLSIGRADVAHAMLAILDDQATFGRPLGIAY